MTCLLRRLVGQRLAAKPARLSFRAKSSKIIHHARGLRPTNVQVEAHPTGARDARAHLRNPRAAHVTAAADQRARAAHDGRDQPAVVRHLRLRRLRHGAGRSRPAASGRGQPARRRGSAAAGKPLRVAAFELCYGDGAGAGVCGPPAGEQRRTVAALRDGGAECAATRACRRSRGWQPHAWNRGASGGDENGSARDAGWLRRDRHHAGAPAPAGGSAAARSVWLRSARECDRSGGHTRDCPCGGGGGGRREARAAGGGGGGEEADGEARGGG